jgi:hypothetical protein
MPPQKHHGNVALADVFWSLGPHEILFRRFE